GGEGGWGVGGGGRVEAVAGGRAGALERDASVVHLDGGWRGERSEAALPEALREREGRKRFAVVEAQARPSAWSELCRRHADVLLLVADASGPPSPGPCGAPAGLGRDSARRVLVLLHPGTAISGRAPRLAPPRAS